MTEFLQHLLKGLLAVVVLLLAVGAGGGHVVGDVPGLRGPPGRGSAGMTLRKAVLERWGGIPTPREQDMALTPNDMNIALSPTQFLSTPR